MDKVIFTKEIRGEEDNDGIFVMLESTEQDTLMIGIQPSMVKISQKFSVASILVVLTLTDRNGVYSNIVKLDPDETFWLTFGVSVKESIRIPIKIANIDYTSTATGAAEDIQFNINFVHASWLDMLAKRRNRSWVNSTIADIVSEMFEESGFTKTDISESPTIYKSTIQPYWSNAHMMRWLQSNCIAAPHDDHFEFGCRLDGTALFTSTSDIIEKNLPKIKDGKIPTLFLGSPLRDEAAREKETAENVGIPTTLLNYGSTQPYMTSVMKGAGGAKSMHWDFATGEYKTADAKLSGMNYLQLSDWSDLKTDHEVVGLRVYGGSNIDNLNRAKSRVSRASLETIEMTVKTVIAPHLHIGDLVELLIPLNPENFKQPFSIINSGFYMITSAEHTINISTGTAETILALSRRGVDDKTLKGYVSSTSGKIFSNRKR